MVDNLDSVSGYHEEHESLLIHGTSVAHHRSHHLSRHHHLEQHLGVEGSAHANFSNNLGNSKTATESFTHVTHVGALISFSILMLIR